MLKEPVSYNTGLWNPKNFYGLVQQKGPWPNQAIDNEKRKPQPLPAGVVGKGGTLHAGHNYWNLDTSFMSDIHTLGDSGSLVYHTAPAINTGKKFVGGGASIVRKKGYKQTFLDPNTLKHFAQLAEFLGKYPGDGDPKDADINRKPLVSQINQVTGTPNIEPTNYSAPIPYLPTRELDINGQYLNSPSSGTFHSARSSSNYSASTGTFYGFPSPNQSPVSTNIPLTPSPTTPVVPGIAPQPGIAPENLRGFRPIPPPIITRRPSNDNQFAPNAFSSSPTISPIPSEILKILEKYPPESPVWPKTPSEDDIYAKEYISTSSSPKINVTINDYGVIKKSPTEYYDQLLNESLKNRLSILGKYKKSESPISINSALSIDTTESNIDLSNRFRNLKEVQSISDKELYDRIKKLHGYRINPTALEFDDLIKLIILSETEKISKSTKNKYSSSSSSSGTEAKFDEKLELLNLENRIKRLFQEQNIEKSPEYFDVFSPKIEGDSYVVDARTVPKSPPTPEDLNDQTYVQPRSVAVEYKGPAISEKLRGKQPASPDLLHPFENKSLSKRKKKKNS